MKRLALVMSTFPTLTETFVAGEIKIMMERFPGSVIYSLRPPFDKRLHAESQELMKLTRYVAGSLSGETLRSNLKWLVTQPVRYLSVLLYVIVHTLSNPLHMLKTLYLFPQAAHLARLVREEKLNHVHSHWATYPTTAALIVSRLIDLPFSFTSHACDMSMMKTFMAEKVKRASFVATCIADNLRFLSTFLPPDQVAKVKVNYHGSNLHKFRPELRREKPAGSRHTVVSCADLHERKGFPYLLQAIRILKDKGYDLECLIVGEGPQRPVLEGLIHKLELHDVVKMLGAVTQEKLIEYYAGADLFVLPCILQHLKFFRKNVDLDRYKILECKMSGGENIQKDGIPNVLVEAMAMKIPVVSTRVAAIPELIQSGENGLLVPERDPQSLAEAMRTLLEDRELCQRLGERGYITVCEKFDRSRNIEELVEIFSRDWTKNGGREVNLLAHHA